MGKEATQGCVVCSSAVWERGQEWRRAEEGLNLWNLRRWPGLFLACAVGAVSFFPSYSQLKFSAAGPGGGLSCPLGQGLSCGHPLRLPPPSSDRGSEVVWNKVCWQRSWEKGNIDY